MTVARIQLTVAIFTLFQAVSTSCDELPRNIQARHGSKPLWIDARDAVATDGKLKQDVFYPHEQDQISRAMKPASRKLNTADHCDFEFGPLFDDAPDTDDVVSWDDLKDRAATRHIIRGRATGMAAGFYSGMPFTLLKIAVGNGAVGNGPFAYVLYPRASVVAGGRTLCTSDPRYSDLPSRGDDIIFVAARAIDADGLVFRPAAGAIISEHAGRLRAGARLEKDARFKAVPSMDAAMTDLRSAVPRH